MTTVTRNGLSADIDKWRETQRAAAVRYAAKKVGKPIAKVSKNRAAANRRRKQMLVEMFPEPENVMCAVPGCCQRADDAHEPLTRGRGGSIEDKNNVVPICRTHHDQITFRPESELAWAYELGLLVHSRKASA